MKNHQHMHSKDKAKMREKNNSIFSTHGDEQCKANNVDMGTPKSKLLNTPHHTTSIDSCYSKQSHKGVRVVDFMEQTDMSLVIHGREKSIITAKQASYYQHSPHNDQFA